MSAAPHKVDLFEAFDVDFYTLKPSAPYWRGIIRLGNKVVARTRRHNTRKAALLEADELLKQITS